MGFREETSVGVRREELFNDRFNPEIEVLKQLGISTYRLGIFLEGEETAFKIFTTNAEYAVPILFSEALNHLDDLERANPGQEYYLKGWVEG
ncbi:MAG TPA: hypothetical protein VJA23_04455 [Candidatus Nanoarchaeia archaeon]|nr:hypothetical protein [Candidatus Nanoarchaeia archaeon]